MPRDDTEDSIDELRRELTKLERERDEALHKRGTAQAECEQLKKRAEVAEAELGIEGELHDDTKAECERLRGERDNAHRFMEDAIKSATDWCERLKNEVAKADAHAARLLAERDAERAEIDRYRKAAECKLGEFPEPSEVIERIEPAVLRIITERDEARAECEQIRAELNALADLWERQQRSYPPDRDGEVAAATVRCCVKELRAELARDRAALTPDRPAEEERTAPVQGGPRIPWSLHLEAWQAYRARGCGQSADDIARRGGFGVAELDIFVPGWRDRMAATGCPVEEPAKRTHEQAVDALRELGRAIRAEAQRRLPDCEVIGDLTAWPNEPARDVLIVQIRVPFAPDRPAEESE